MNRRVVVNEIVLVLRRPQGRRGPITVAVENAEPRDRCFITALARVVEVWFAAMGRRAA